MTEKVVSSQWGSGMGKNSAKGFAWDTGGSKTLASSIYGKKRIVSGKAQDLNMVLRGPEARPHHLQQKRT